MARLIKVFEHERLTLTPNERGDCLMQGELERLYDFNDRNENKYFTGIRDGVKFGNYVGVIRIGNLTLEILPKSDRKENNSKADYEKWQNVLIYMLRICRKIRVQAVSKADLKPKYHSLLELYFQLYLDSVEELVRRGLIKKYRSDVSNTPALKGRIDFAKNIRSNLIRQERFYTTHQVYDYEHTINQILLRGLRVLNSFLKNSTLKDRISRILLDFPVIKEIEINESHFDALDISRKSIAYDEALKIAKMIILNYSPDIKNGRENMLALLFDMNKLWEEYVYRMLHKDKPADIEISFQNSQVFWEERRIKPDIIVTKKTNLGEETFVIDTKWKIVEDGNPSDDDLRQMFAYNLYWGSARSMLLYPTEYRWTETFGTFHKGRTTENSCKLGFINILNSSGALNMNIGREILNKLI